MAIQICAIIEMEVEVLIVVWVISFQSLTLHRVCKPFHIVRAWRILCKATRCSFSWCG